MIDFINIANYKDLESFSMATKRLNIITGDNNSGSSYLLECLINYEMKVFHQRPITEFEIELYSEKITEENPLLDYNLFKVVCENRFHNNNVNELLYLDDNLKNEVELFIQKIFPNIILYLELEEEFGATLSFFEKQKEGEYQSNLHIIYEIIPVITALLSSKEDNIVLIKYPEMYLSPKEQSLIGNLIAKTASKGTQLFIETHSDHIINSIRVAVKEKVIDNKEVAIVHFNRVEEDIDSLKIRIDKYGELSNYPDGFLDEWGNQLMKLLDRRPVINHNPIEIDEDGRIENFPDGFLDEFNNNLIKLL